MRQRHSRYIAITLTLALIVCSSIPRGVFGIKNLSPITEADAQLLGGGGGQGMMQMLPQLMMLMMLMQMMSQKKGDTASGKVKDARDSGLQNLQQSNASPGGTPQTRPAQMNPPSNGIFVPIK